MENKLQYRQALASDFEVISQLPQNEEELFWMFPRAIYPLTIDQVKTAVESRYNSIVVLLDNQVVGFANFYEVIENESCSVGNVIVKTDCRGCGIGEYILKILENIALKEHNAKVLHLSCFGINTIGLLLYTKLGYVPHAIEDRVNKHGVRYASVQMTRIIRA